MTASPRKSSVPALPAGATDTHVHVFDPARHPFSPAATYHPEPHECGTADDLATTLASHGVGRVVIVSATAGYRDDMRCMLDAVARLRGRARGIARGPLDVSARDLRRWQSRGVTGFRVDLIGDGLPGGVDALRQLAARLADLGLVLDLQCEGDGFAEIGPSLAGIPVRIVVDHVGRPAVAKGVAQPGFRALLAAVAAGRCWVKLSGALRISRRPPPYADVDRYVARLLAEGGPGRLVWGSDWPFLRTQRRVDYGPMLAQLAAWVPDARSRRRILVDTPADLFGFG